MDFFFENHVLDLSRRELRRGGNPVAVEPQVFDLLVYLVGNRDRVVSKDDLIAGVWQGRIVSESTLTSRINAARKALGDSGEAQRLIRTLPRKGFRFVGEVTTKGQSPVAASNVSSGGDPSPPPEKPSIAVLPFQNMSGDPEQEYLADGMTEDLITLLSQTLAFVVTSNNSSFGYKTRPVDVADVARQLNVRYVLEGSVRKAGNQIRVATHLVEARTGNRVWGDRFDREITDIFAVQDDVTSAIVGALHPQLLSTEGQSFRHLKPSSLDAWGLVVRGMMALISLTRENIDVARELSRQAIKIAPDYGMAYGVRAFSLGYSAYTQWGQDWYADARQSSADIKRCLALAGDDPTALFLAGGASMFMGRLQTGIGLLERALQLNPNLAMAQSLLGLGYASIGRPAEGLANVARALRLSPRDPMAYLFYAAQGFCHFAAGDHAKAVASCEMGLRINGASVDNFLYMAAALSCLGEMEKARKQIERALRIAPNVRLATIENAIENGNVGWAKYHAALRSAGLK